MVTHQHHILPKHMGGSDDPSNLVNVSIPMHAALHQDLYQHFGHLGDYVAWKMLEGKSDECEAERIELSKQGFRRFYNSPEYETFKKQISASLTGRKLSEAHKQAMSEGAKKSWKTPSKARLKAIAAPHQRGYQLSEDHRAKLKVARNQRVTTIETRKKLSLSHKERVFDESARAKISAATKGIRKGARKVSIDGIVYQSMKCACDATETTWGILSRQIKSDKYPTVYFLES